MEADAPLEILPLFVRAGSIVPFGPDVQSTEEARKDSSLLLRIYQGRDATFTLYKELMVVAVPKVEKARPSIFSTHLLCVKC